MSNPMSARGVGQGIQNCRHVATLPIAIPNINSPAVSGRRHCPDCSGRISVFNFETQIVDSSRPVRGRRSTWRHLPALCVAGVLTSSCTLRGRRSTYDTGLAPVARLVAVGRLRRRDTLAGVALGDMDVAFAWQAWRLATSTCTLRGRCGTFETWVGSSGALAAWEETCAAVAACASRSLSGMFDWNLVQAMFNVLFGMFCRNFVQAILACFTEARWQNCCTSHSGMFDWNLVQAMFNVLFGMFDWNLVQAMFNVLFGSFRHVWQKLCASHSRMFDWNLVQAMFNVLCLFLTPLCGVVVFDSVSVPPAPPTLSHTLFHTQLCHTPSFTHNCVTHHLSHNFATHHLSHTTLSYTLFHTQLCHTPSFTHNFVTHSLSHTTLSHTILHTIAALGDMDLCVAGVALGDIHLRLAWQAWHLWHRAGSGGALGAPWSPVAPRHFAWQAWHSATSTFVLRGRRGTYVTGLALVAWQAWHLATWTSHLRGRRCTWRHTTSFHVAGVAPMALGWLWWSWSPVRGTLRGRRGTWRHGPSFRVAGVAVGNIDLRFAWQRRAWGPLAGTWRHGHSICVAGVPLRDMNLAFAWQAWPLMALGWLWWLWSPVEAFASFSCASLYTIFHTHTCVTHIFQTQLYHTQLFTYNCFSFSILHHLLCLSFLPHPATTFAAHYWKKVTGGAIRSFNLG